MQLSYKKLWKMLIDQDMSKQDLREKAGISSASMAKLGKGENITTDVLLKICKTMNCKVEDIIETISDDEE
ncbi:MULTISPECIES: helix-turn-helix domain-containing protein [unclassified Blautia]|uniref:helix-turn-helix domain-containing protein n=1 Tax=unclassified Blautia TaxID=2648079 RepID=UPI003F89238E